jgi:hypothetical protein
MWRALRADAAVLDGGEGACTDGNGILPIVRSCSRRMHFPSCRVTSKSELGPVCCGADAHHVRSACGYASLDSASLLASQLCAVSLLAPTRPAVPSQHVKLSSHLRHTSRKRLLLAAVRVVAWSARHCARSANGCAGITLAGASSTLKARYIPSNCRCISLNGIEILVSLILARALGRHRRNRLAQSAP